MRTVYKTKGTCSSEIWIEVEDGIIRDISFTGGCDGNLKGISLLVKGKSASEVAALLEGVKCGRRETSCPDQLARALKSILQRDGTIKNEDSGF